MKKNKPEIGDIWQSSRRYSQKIYITNVLGRVYCVTEQGVASSRYFSDFREGGTYKYLGKSKVNIQQLFEVQDEKQWRNIV